MSLKVKDVIRELKKFPNDYKVSLETYEVDNNNGVDTRKLTQRQFVAGLLCRSYLTATGLFISGCLS